MTDRTRSTLRLRLPPTSAPPARPAAVQVPARPAPYPPARAVMAARPTAPATLDACSRAILEELAAIGLADPPEG